MPSFSGNQGAFTPATTNDNWTLDAQGTAGVFGRVTEFSWGGRLTTSTGYRTRWTRASTLGTGAGTAITTQGNNPNYTSAGCALFSTYATTQPTLPADPNNLHAQDWNAQGGVGYIVLPLAQPWWVLGNGGVSKQEINCRNVAGTDANGSTYGVVWQED
jgi:hypothetical protein